MTYSLEIYTDTQKTDSNGDLLNSYFHKFDDLHTLATFVVNLSDKVTIEFDSGDATGSQYRVWDGKPDSRAPTNYFIINSDKELLDFCLKKHFGCLLIDGEDDNYFRTNAGSMWIPPKSYVISEHTYQATAASRKFKSLAPGRSCEN